MTDQDNSERDYSKTLFLPQTEFPMRAGLPKKEPELIAQWDQKQLYKKLREQSKGRPNTCFMMALHMQMAIFILAMRSTKY